MATKRVSAKIINLNDDGSPWPDGDVRKLKALVEAGHSHGRIAKKLKRTRNQIIGKVHRLGLREPASRERVAADNSLALRIASLDRRSRAVSPHVLKASTAWAPDAVVGLPELAETSCRWPVGDPKAEGFGFCGCVRQAGYSYCEAHVRVAYVVAPEPGEDAIAIAA